MKRKRRQLGSSDVDHARAAQYELDKAWGDLERMPPTCRGGIVIAARALGYAERAQGHLASIEDPRVREEHTKIFGSANRAAHAAHETVQFFAGVCEAPGREAGERPLFSRAKVAREEAAREAALKRKRRR